MKQIFRKGLSLIFTALLTVSVFAPAVFAEEAETEWVEPLPKKVTQLQMPITVTVSLKGQFQRGADNTLMVRVPFVVKDADGNKKITVKEALTQLHAKYCPGGFSTRAEKCGPVIDKLWGKKAVDAQFRVNDKLGFALRDTLDFYDDLYVYTPVKAYSYDYAYFSDPEEHTVIYRDYNVTLLKKTNNDSGKEVSVPVKGAQLYEIRKNGTLVDLGVKTDEEGRATLHFNRAGSYLITAKSKDETYILPTWKVNVYPGLISFVLDGNKK